MSASAETAVVTDTTSYLRREFEVSASWASAFRCSSLSQPSSRGETRGTPATGSTVSSAAERSGLLLRGGLRCHQCPDEQQHVIPGQSSGGNSLAPCSTR
jgi:hypothetical protein